MKPELFVNSDAPLNVDLAVGALNVLDRGVYIALNDRVIEWDKCKETREQVNFSRSKHIKHIDTVGFGMIA